MSTAKPQFPKETPLLMTGPLVLQTLADLKTQTRRVMNPQPVCLNSSQYEWKGEMANIHGDPVAFWKCPYGSVGDRLWVRGAHAFNPALVVSMLADGRPLVARHVRYAADGNLWPSVRCRPSIFMPRWASRLTLEIIDIRVERVRDISIKDAIAEGIGQTWGDFHGNVPQ